MGFMLFIDKWWDSGNFYRDGSVNSNKIMGFMLFVRDDDKWSLDDDESTNSNKNCKSWASYFWLTNDDRQWDFFNSNESVNSNKNLQTMGFMLFVDTWWQTNKWQKQLQIMGFMLFVDKYWQSVGFLMMMSQQTAIKICKPWVICYLLTNDDKWWNSL